MTSADFEARYRADPDPWDYLSSDYERDKYAATLAACGPGPFSCALELGSSIGVFSAMLAPRCRRLVTIDAAATAVASARVRLAEHRHVTTILGEIPGAVPAECYDLVVASEILYYLSPRDLDATLATATQRMCPGARLVAVHWRPSGPERPFDAESTHARLRACAGLRPVQVGGTDEYLLDVMVRR
jgi:cyclopropane fatty-acyl-phospholipid synthase-like methyltransferase